MTDDTDTTNIRPFRIVAANEQEAEPETEALPTDEYVITLMDGTERFAEGFMLFTSHHVAIMRETPKGAMPILVVPLSNVAAAELVDDAEDELPF